MQNTIDYYKQNVKSFIDGTRDVNFAEIQDTFLELLPENARILDFGCGSGRDAKYFLEQGYMVDMVIFLISHLSLLQRTPIIDKIKLRRTEIMLNPVQEYRR